MQKYPTKSLDEKRTHTCTHATATAQFGTDEWRINNFFFVQYVRLNGYDVTAIHVDDENDILQTQAPSLSMILRRNVSSHFREFHSRKFRSFETSHTRRRTHSAHTPFQSIKCAFGCAETALNYYRSRYRCAVATAQSPKQNKENKVNMQSSVFIR